MGNGYVQFYIYLERNFMYSREEKNSPILFASSLLLVSTIIC